MKRYSKPRMILLIMTALTLLGTICLSGNTTAEGNNGDPAGFSERIGNITVLSLNGTWYEMGRQYGELAGEQLREVFDFCYEMIEAREGNSEQAVAIIGSQVEQMPYTIREFFRGAAETSGLTEDQLYTANAAERVAGLPKCSMAAIWGDYAADGMIVGRNYDYGEIFKDLRNDVLVTVFNPADGALSTATVGYAGEIYAVNGMNEAGFFMELNNGKPSAPVSAPDERITGTTLLLDMLFETDSFELLDRYFNTMLCSSSYIINVLDGEHARSYEWCPLGVKHGEEYNQDGMLVSTNHFVNPEWDLAQPTDETSWESFTRRDNLIRLCESKKGTVDADTMKQIISVPIEEGGALNELTVYQIVAEPASRIMWVRTADSEQWAEIDLNAYWQ